MKLKIFHVQSTKITSRHVYANKQNEYNCLNVFQIGLKQNRKCRQTINFSKCPSSIFSRRMYLFTFGDTTLKNIIEDPKVKGDKISKHNPLALGSH